MEDTGFSCTDFTLSQNWAKPNYNSVNFQKVVFESLVVCKSCNLWWVSRNKAFIGKSWLDSEWKSLCFLLSEIVFGALADFFHICRPTSVLGLIEGLISIPWEEGGLTAGGLADKAEQCRAITSKYKAHIGIASLILRCRLCPKMPKM